MGGQIITFWTGQCGVQLGNACWELYALEHCIAPDGKFYADSVENDNSCEHFFMETGQGQFVPRSLFIDLEPTVIDEVKIGVYRRLFNPDSLISGCEDASNNFARGFYTSGRQVIRDVVQMTRKTTENGDCIQAFMIHHSFGGGTGSGFTSMLLEYLAVEYAKTAKIEYGVFPSNSYSVAVVEPYNTVLALHTPMENADLAAFFENECAYRIINNNLDIQNITFTEINRLVSQALSGTTASLRFEGPINANIIDYQTNLVPYPRIHFPIISFGPVSSAQKVTHDSGTVKEITEQAFLKDNQMASVHPMEGAYMSCCLLYRGDINVLDVNRAIMHLKKTWQMPWVDWCPTGFKVGINYQPMLPIPGSGVGYSPRALTMLCNTTAFRSIVANINKKFMLLFDRKAFIHWYVTEGMEENEFSEAFEDVLMLEKDYEVIESTSEKGRDTDYSQTQVISKTVKSNSSSESESESEPESGNESESGQTSGNSESSDDDSTNQSCVHHSRSLNDSPNGLCSVSNLQLLPPPAPRVMTTSKYLIPPSTTTSRSKHIHKTSVTKQLWGPHPADSQTSLTAMNFEQANDAGNNATEQQPKLNCPEADCITLKNFSPLNRLIDRCLMNDAGSSNSSDTTTTTTSTATTNGGAVFNVNNTRTCNNSCRVTLIASDGEDDVSEENHVSVEINW